MADHSLPITLYSPDKQVRLSIPTSKEDEQVSVLRSDPRTRLYLPFLPVQSVASIAERRETRSKDPHILDLIAFNGDSDEVIGMTGVFNIDDMHKTCETGILISPNGHGAGVATKVLYTLLKYIFEVRGFHRTNFETSETNAPMRGWLEKVAGARCEAKRLEAWTDCNGGRMDVMSYAVLQSEWNDRVKKALEKRLGLVDGE